MTTEYPDSQAPDPDLDPKLGGVQSQRAETAVAEDPANAAAAPEVEIATLTKALDEARDNVLRTHAEMQNLRRRMERDIENAHKYALEKFAAELLPVVDNLERALSALDAEQRHSNPVIDSLGEGVELTLKSLLDALGRHKVVPVHPRGEAFDPDFHQAVAALPHAEIPPNRVLDVLQKGYTLSGRLLRPAMVVVSKGDQNAPQG